MKQTESLLLDTEQVSKTSASNVVAGREFPEFLVTKDVVHTHTVTTPRNTPVKSSVEKIHMHANCQVSQIILEMRENSVFHQG